MIISTTFSDERPSRGLRFGLKTLLLIITMIALIIGAYVVGYRSGYDHRKSVDAKVLG